MTETKKNTVKNFAATAKKRGEENLRKVLVWVFKWGFSTEQVLQTLLQVKRKPGVDLVRRGVLQKTELRGLPHVYTLTPAFQLNARQLFEDEMNAYLDNMAIPYPYPGNAIPESHVIHQELSQLAALASLQTQGGDVLFSSRELMSGIEQNKPSAVPDFEIWHWDAQADNHKKTWYEVELNAKYQERLVNQLERRHVELKKQQLHALVFLCGTAGIKKNIEQALGREQLPKTKKNATHKLVVIPGEFWKPVTLKKTTLVCNINEWIYGEEAGQRSDAELLNLI